MHDEVELRGYRREDLRAISDLDETCFAEPFRFDLRSMRRFAEAREAVSIIASRKEDRAAILGFVIVHLSGRGQERRGYVVTLDVAPARRRSGVAGLLMDEVEGLSKAARAVEMGLHVYAGNEGAIRFYEARGYEFSRVQRGFYGNDDGVSLDALVYFKGL